MQWVCRGAVVMKVQGEGHDKPRKPGRRFLHHLLPAVLSAARCAAAPVAPSPPECAQRNSGCAARRGGDAERAASVLTRPSLTRCCVRTRRCALLRRTRLPAEDELPIDINFTKMEDWLKERQKAKILTSPMYSDLI